MNYYLALLLALFGFWFNDAIICHNPEDLGNGLALCHKSLDRSGTP